MRRITSNAPPGSSRKPRFEGQRPGAIPALGNAQGRLVPTDKGLKARHQIMRKPEGRWIGPSALMPSLIPSWADAHARVKGPGPSRGQVALAKTGIEPGLRPSNAEFRFMTHSS